MTRPEPVAGAEEAGREGMSSFVTTFTGTGGLFALSFCACLAMSAREGEGAEVSCPRPGAQTTSANAHDRARHRIRGIVFSRGHDSNQRNKRKDRLTNACGLSGKEI